MHATIGHYLDIDKALIGTVWGGGENAFVY